MALLLCNTRPRIAWARDYPWGMRETEFQRELADIDAGWGTRAKAEADAVRTAFAGMPFGEQANWYLECMWVSARPGDAVAAFRMFCTSSRACPGRGRCTRCAETRRLSGP